VRECLACVPTPATRILGSGRWQSVGEQSGPLLFLEVSSALTKRQRDKLQTPYF